MAEAAWKFETVERTVREEKYVGVTLELTVKEARALQGLVGKEGLGPGVFVSLYYALVDVLGFVGEGYILRDKISGKRIDAFALSLPEDPIIPDADSIAEVF